MKRNIIVAKKALSPILCNEIIELGKNQLHKGGVGEGDVNKNIRNSEICFFNGSLTYFNLYKPLLELVQQVNNKFSILFKTWSTTSDERY